MTPRLHFRPRKLLISGDINFLNIFLEARSLEAVMMTMEKE